MYHNRQINFFPLLLIFTCSILGKTNQFVITHFPYPQGFSQTGFQPDYVQIGINNRMYFMDTKSKTICLINGDELKWSGGFGFEKDEFISPVSMVYSNLSLFVLDQSQSKITEFDSNLHLISSFSLDVNYPDLFRINPLNEFIIFSNSDQILFRYKSGFLTKENMVDLNQYHQISPEVTDIFINDEGEIGILSSQSSLIFLLHPSGRYDKPIYCPVENPKWLFSLNGEWVIFNEFGSYVIPESSKEIFNLPVHNIHFMTEKNKILYALSHDGFYKWYFEK